MSAVSMAGETDTYMYVYAHTIGQVSRFRAYSGVQVRGRWEVACRGTNTGITNCNWQQQKQHK